MLVRYVLKSKQPLQSPELALGSGELREVLLLFLSEQLLLTYQVGEKPAESALGG